MRLPGGCDSRESLAGFLRDGRTGTGLIPAGRWDTAAFASAPGAPVEPGKIATAGVDAFGFTGTNAHVLLESAPATRPAGPPGGIRLDGRSYWHDSYRWD
jgi:acyl transferase domain-containing protein